MPSMPSSGSAIKAAQIDMPKGGGALQGIGEAFATNAFTGTASLNIPLPVSPGRGFAPQLAVEYSSGGGNSTFGIGFELSLPSISRRTSKGIPRYAGDDIFVLSGAGNLVPDPQAAAPAKVPAGYGVRVYRPQIEGLFARIEQWTDQATSSSYWKVVDKDNTTSFFGAVPTGHGAKAAHAVAPTIADPADPARVFRWLPAESADAHGNRMVFSYKQEDRANVPATLSEVNRSAAANKYLERVQYGADSPTATPPQWHFEVVFDYGEYDIAATNATPYKPTKTWKVRQDPFSTYSAGFEIRTYRLCRNVLMFHRFKDLGADPVLVDAVQFDYDENPTLTRLSAVTRAGYRHQPASAAQPYAVKKLPPLDFAYTDFKPQDNAFEPLDDDGPDPLLPGVDRGPDYQLIDLYGEGIPGVLYSDGHTTYYWSPEGGGPADQDDRAAEFAGPRAPDPFPVARQLQAADQHLMDLRGDGLYDLVLSAPGRAGYYPGEGQGAWGDYAAFRAFPSDFHAADVEMVDLTGDGRADVVRFEEDLIRFYPSQGQRGFGAPEQSPRRHAVPLPSPGDRSAVVRFADIAGAGLAQRVRVADGEVSYWPNLGYGRFGAEVRLDNAPRYAGGLDAERLFLADLDGSGTADIIYLHPDRAEVFLNQSGNSFAAPFSVPLPRLADRLDRIRFADVYGNGTQCLVFSDDDVRPRQWCYDFSGGQKAYLLNRVDNNMGAQNEITYASSVRYYLADKRRGRPWITRLPFPVQVVAQTKSVDAIADTSLESSYSYHHGYYNAAEREFFGFGMVERRDAQSFAEYRAQHPKAKPGTAHYVAPALSKTWYHTGVWEQEVPLLAQYRREYFGGDAQVYKKLESGFSFVGQPDAEAARQAAWALKGAVLREELYGLDDSPQAAVPYTVSESAYNVIELQAPTAQAYGVYLSHSRESIHYDYERDAADPRIGHDFVLDFDQDFGQVRRSCAVAYGRRPQKKARVLPEQTALKVVVSQAEYINETASFRQIGLPKEEKSYHLPKAALPKGSSYFTFAQIEGVVDNVLGKLPKPGAAPPKGAKPGAVPQDAELLSWVWHYYWSPTTQASLPLGQVTAEALPSHREWSEFSDAAVKAVLTGTPGLPTDAELVQKLQSGQYFLKDGYWWGSGLKASYYLDTKTKAPDDVPFYLLKATTDPFGHATTYDYDDYHLLLKKVTDAVGNTTQVQAFDYQVLQPQKVADANENIAEVLFDALGMVVASAHYGSEYVGGKVQTAAGFKSLDAASYTPQQPASAQDVLNSPTTYLQQAASYFYYDLDAWQNNKTPAHALSLTATQYPTAAGAAPADTIAVGIAYSDGFGRILQEKTKVEPGDAFAVSAGGSGTPPIKATTTRWLSSGRKVYDNKGAPVKEYEPYYVDSADYVDNAALNTFGVSPTLHYDPLQRLVQVDTPKGFLTKVEFTPWQENHYDEDDTLLQAPFYQANVGPQAPQTSSPYYEANLSAAEKRALEQASLLADTPETQVFDNLGRTIRSVRKNQGLVTADAFTAAPLSLSATDAKALVAELQTNGYVDFRGALTYKFTSDPSGLSLSSAFTGQQAAIVKALQQIQQQGETLTTELTLSIQGYQLASADPRLAAAQAENFTTTYSLTGQPLKSVSADAGTRWALANVLGHPLYSRDARAFVYEPSYDALQRPVALKVSGGDGAKPLDLTTDRVVYGDSIPSSITAPSDLTARNLRGAVYQAYDSAGQVVSQAYNILGAPLQTQRTLAQDYKTQPDWQSIDATAQSTILETTSYATTLQYDALGRLIDKTDPGNNQHLATYSPAGRLQTLALTPDGGTTTETYVSAVAYNARNQRTQITYGNTTQSSYSYDPKTFRLTNINTIRPKTATDPQKTLQDLSYTYDPVGNVVQTDEGAFDTIFSGQQQVDPTSKYIYDALYQLVQASGREHPGLSQNDYQSSDFGAIGFVPLANPNSQQELQNYTRRYRYDRGGNLTQIQHVASKSAKSWTRDITVAPTSNRAVNATLTTDPSKVDDYFDAHGNQTQMETLRAVGWDFKDRIAAITIVARGTNPSDGEYYVYDGGGQRIRKVSERQGKNANTVETLYLDGVEIHRVMPGIGTGATSTQERHTVQVGEASGRVALRLAWKSGAPKGIANPQQRYQLDNQLDSVTLETDAEGKLITYEEYFPYGGTALTSGTSLAEVKLKQYRYSGQERDALTGLYYYGARYYAPWVGRWLSPDPAGTVDGLNLFAFVRGNPLTFRDVGGMAMQGSGEEPPKEEPPVPGGGRSGGGQGPAPKLSREAQALAKSKARAEAGRAREAGDQGRSFGGRPAGFISGKASKAPAAAVGHSKAAADQAAAKPAPLSKSEKKARLLSLLRGVFEKETKLNDEGLPNINANIHTRHSDHPELRQLGFDDHFILSAELKEASTGRGYQLKIRNINRENSLLSGSDLIEHFLTVADARGVPRSEITEIYYNKIINKDTQSKLENHNLSQEEFSGQFLDTTELGRFAQRQFKDRGLASGPLEAIDQRKPLEATSVEALQGLAGKSLDTFDVLVKLR